MVLHMSTPFASQQPRTATSRPGDYLRCHCGFHLFADATAAAPAAARHRAHVRAFMTSSRPGAARRCPPGPCQCGTCPPPQPGNPPRRGPARPGHQQKAPPGLTIETAALGYIRHGWPVFMLGRSKRPVANCATCRTPGHDRDGCRCLTCHGFYAATTGPARFAAMLAAVPAGLLAIRTGTPSGLAVVDIDPRNGGTIDKELMTPTATVATGGGGWHLYYRHPGGPLLPALPGHPGIDVKADGGYVAAPPSTHPATRQPYQWAGTRAVTEMPPALRAALAPPPPPAPPPPLSSPPPAPGAGGISSPGALLAAHLRAVQNAPEGTRRRTLYGAARGVARMVTAGAISHHDAHAALTAAGLAAQQAPRDIRAAISGAFHDEGAAA
jgi:hypothetical protein